MKILIAEDDNLYQVLLGSILQEWDYKPVLVDNGESAWEALNSPDGPQLAILDWVMPGADGIEVCRRVRAARLPHYVYLVLFTSKTDGVDLLTGLEAGADDYLFKPIHLSQLKLRLRAAERVLQAEKRHRIIAEIASDGITTMGSAGTIQYANRSAGAIFGSAPAELIDKPFSELVPGFSGLGNLQHRETPIHQEAGQGRTWAPTELMGRHRTGRLIPLEVSFAESMEGPQEPLFTAVIRDVTERKSRDNRRAHVQKLESIGALAAGVAHEINTPIQFIGDNLRFIQASVTAMQHMLDSYRRSIQDPSGLAAGSSQLLELDANARSLELDYLALETPPAIEQAIEGAQRVAEIVRALREFSHPGSEEPAAVDLNHLLENAALVSRNRWKYVADLKTNFDPTLPRVCCVAGELNQVFLNLIVNAADAIAMTLESNPEKKGELLITTRHDEEFAEVRIRDNGTGMPEPVQARIFDPFFTTKPVGSGTGQGLSIAYAIVSAKHRGSIECETEVGVGTTFIVRLPIDGPESQITARRSFSDVQGGAIDGRHGSLTLDALEQPRNASTSKE